MANILSNVLELHNVNREFGTESIVYALRDIELQLASGEWLAITGPSGAGKSTLLNILGCLDRVTNGTYHLNGIDTRTLNDRQRAGLRSQHIGFVFQSFHLLPHRTVLENVMLGDMYGNHRHGTRRERALASLERVGLGHRVEFMPPKLSGGEQQRVAIARALIGSPSLLLCDEPTGNLDSKSSASVLDLFESLNQQGLTIVIVTHNEQVAKRASRRVHIIDGALTDITTPENTSSLTAVLTTDQPINAISQSGISLRDLFNEAVAGMFARPGRMMLTILGVIIGITALVATLGISRTAGNRIISQFDELAATEIIVTSKSGATVVDNYVIPWDASERLQRLNGVVAAGTLTKIDTGTLLVSSSPVRDPQSQTSFNLSVQAGSPELFSAVRAELATGRFSDIGNSNRRDRVAVLGPVAAKRLRIVSLEQQPAISIGDNFYLVIGILSTVKRQPDLLSSVIIPEGTARYDFGVTAPGSVVIETKIGAVPLIVKQTPLALRPDDPTVFKMQFLPEPKRVREAIQEDLNAMFLMLAGLSLIVGAIGIGNITLVSVMERTGEIGLRRAIGATQGHIAAQFLLESTTMGLAGGIIGTSIGVLTVVVVSVSQVWTPIMDPTALVIAPLLGAVIGLVSGTYPAMRAARMEPVEAFRN